MAPQIDLTLYASLLVAAMVANGSAALVKRGHPLDFGLKLPDGRRVLGDGKTFEGFATGFAFGSSVGLAILALVGRLSEQTMLALALSVAGALGGDIAASFLKRRLGLERGARLEVVDQLDFYAGFLAVLLCLGYVVDPLIVAVSAAAIYVLHRLTNIAAYKLGIKDRPW